MDKLGINPTLILMQVFNFFLLMLLLKKFLYHPILNMLDARREQAEQNQKLQTELETDKAGLNEQKQIVINEGKQEAEKIMQSAQEKGEAVRKQLEKDAQKRAAEIEAEGKQRLEAEEQAIRRKLESDVTRVALEAAESVIGQSLSADQKDKILHEAVRRFTAHA
ncbi:MAG TPA: F0F1 ATP synthase subunit B [bacterium]|nr:F0F1 ATP synthase subunit B [bacterium]